MSKRLTLSLLLLFVLIMYLPLQVFAQPDPMYEVASWMWDTLTNEWIFLSSPAQPDPLAPARAFSVSPQDGSCLSDTIQWIQWAITGTRWEWWVREPGIYAANAITFTVASDSDVVIDYEGFEALQPESIGVDSTVRVWYAEGDYPWPPPPSDPAWISAEDLNSHDDTLYDSQHLENGIQFKKWNMIEVKESYSPCDYSDTARVYFRTYGTCDESHPFSVVVHYQPWVSADFVASPESGYVPLQVQFTDLSEGDPTSWFWDFGDDSTSTAPNPTHTYRDTGYFDVKLVVANSQYTDSLIREDYIHVSFLCGDANGDAVIDLGDVIFLISYLFRSGHPPYPLEAGDANWDGVVRVGDIVYLVNYLFRGGPPPCY